MASILFSGGLAQAIGILGRGELGGEGVRKGATGNESRSGVGNKRGFKEKANELKSADAPLFTGVVKIGVGKSSAVLGLCQGTALEERGVTRVSPSNPRLGGEKSYKEHSRNSGNGTPQKEVSQESEEEKMEFLQKEMADYLVWQGELLLQGLFLF
jgi:hypothetical protein